MRLKVDIIVYGRRTGDPAAKNATKTIPIVMAQVRSCEAGCRQSCAARRKYHGLTNLAVELGGKRLELLKEAVPKLSRVAVLWSPTSPGSDLQVKEIRSRGARDGIDASILERYELPTISSSVFELR